MANDGTIASKLQLDGEQQYKKALNDAYRSLRVLRSELKAETAELGRNATQQDKARTKMASLQKQIAEQQKIVKTLEKALADSKKEYADNTEVQDKWAEKLNKAREALANMQNAMGTCEDTLTKFGTGMEKVADSSGEALQTVVSFSDAIKSISSVAGGIGNTLSGIFTSSVDTMKQMVDEMYALMGEAWAAAGDWKDIQSIWGGDLQSIQRVFTGMKLQGVDTGEITSGIQKLVSNTHSGNKDTVAALKALHIQEKDYTNHWDYFIDVMEALDRHKGADREKLVHGIFGDKKGSGMMLVLDNWRDAMNKYEEDIEETGLDLSSPEIEALDEVSHKITEIQELWNSIRVNIGAKLSSVLNMDKLSEDTLEILRTIGSLLNAEGDAKAELTVKLSENIETLLTDISTAMGNLSDFLKELGGTLEESDNPLVQFIGKLISSLGGILDWLSQNSGTIIEWLNRLLPLMAANKVSEAVTGKGIGDWLTDTIKLGVDFAILGKTFGGAAGAAMGTTAATFGTTAGSALGTGLLKAVPALAFLKTLFKNALTEQGNDDLYDENGNVTAIGRELGLPETQAEADARGGASAILYGTEEEQREANKNSLLGKGGIADRVGEAGKVTSEQYIRLNDLWQNYSGQYHTNESQKDLLDKAREAFAGNEDEFEGWVKKIYELSHGDNLPKYLPEEWFGVRKQEEENIDLDPTYSEAQKIEAIQDWWDAWRNASGGGDSWDEEGNAFAWMQEVLGDQFGDVWDAIVQGLDKTKNQNKLEDLPADWFQSISSGLKNLTRENYSGSENEALPGKIATAVAGAVRGVPITVNVIVDGDTVTRTVNRNLGGQLSELIV